MDLSNTSRVETIKVVDASKEGGLDELKKTFFKTNLDKIHSYGTDLDTNVI